MATMKNEALRRVLWLLLLGLPLPAAAAQGSLADAETTGTISGTFDGSELQWQTLEMDMGDDTQSTATFSVVMDMFHNYSLQGHQDRSLIEGTVAINFSSFTGPLSDCPCELQGEITYWPTTSMFDDVYMAQDAVITVLEAEELADGVLRLVGTAQGQLDFHASIMSQEATGEPVAIMLEFAVDRVHPVELDY